MNLEQGDDWPKYSFACGTNMPNGCLINPEGSKLIFFEEIKHSPRNNLKSILTLSTKITLESLPF